MILASIRKQILKVEEKIDFFIRLTSGELLISGQKKSSPSLIPFLCQITHPFHTQVSKHPFVLIMCLNIWRSQKEVYYSLPFQWIYRVTKNWRCIQQEATGK